MLHHIICSTPTPVLYTTLSHVPNATTPPPVAVLTHTRATTIKHTPPHALTADIGQRVIAPGNTEISVMERTLPYAPSAATKSPAPAIWIMQT